jgi:hypothetical protein
MRRVLRGGLLYLFRGYHDWVRIPVCSSDMKGLVNALRQEVASHQSDLLCEAHFAGADNDLPSLGHVPLSRAEVSNRYLVQTVVDYADKI